MALLLCVQPRARAQVEWPVINEQTKPWTRWWWMGNAVDRKDLVANLSKYAAAGLGGLELTPIYGVRGYEGQFVNYLSPQWMSLFTYTLGEAKRLGLGMDMSTGTGWPFGGGPLIDSNYACREMFSRVWAVKGGETITEPIRFQQEPLVHTDGRHTVIDSLVEPVFANKDLQALALFQVRWPHSLPPFCLMAYSSDGRVVDLMGKIDSTGRLGWTAPAGGAWQVYGLFLGWHGKMVERAAPGAEGNVIDHFSTVALRKYLSRFDTAFGGADLSPLRSFFNDSYEVDDSRGESNWTSDLFDTFHSHRGYDLREHLPALLGRDSAGNNASVICDYRETISDLLLEQFTEPWREWAHAKGRLVRDQAHGSPANILDLYAAADIPETEGSEVLRFKFATSAAHVAGRKLASSESGTWLGEHFVSSYADVKKALDKYWLGGVNHVIYHGTAYTPMADPWPGWLFYASVHFTPNDPDWADFSALNGYAARVQSFLQQGVPDNDILLYYPLYDSWSGKEGGAPGKEGLLKHYDRMDPEFSGTGFKACAEWMQAQGYAFDYISDKQLRECRPRDAAVVTSGGAKYRAVLLPDCRYLSVAAMEKLVRLADAGVPVLVYKALPSGPPGYGDYVTRAATFRQLLARLRFSLSGDPDSLMRGAGVRRESLVGDSLAFVRRKYGNGHVYFIVNTGSSAWRGYAALASGFASAAIFDPMTGVKGLARRRGSAVYLQLQPGESCIVQTAATELHGVPYPYYQPAGEAVALQGPWRLAFLSGGPVIPAAVTVQRLGSWTELGSEDVKNFSGAAMYSMVFGRPKVAHGGASGDGAMQRGGVRAWLLDLGKVDRTAEVFLNGQRLAVLIGPDYRVIVPAADIHERNTMQIKISNGMVNRIEDMDRKGIVWKKFYNYNFPAHERVNRGANGLFDASAWKPMASGLSGPVTLTPLVTAGIEDWVTKVGARSLPVTKVVVVVSGVSGDGTTLCTRAIQAAIDSCAAKGGGVVAFLPGQYLTGSLFLKENVDLRIDKGVELTGSQHFEDYPEIDTRIAGIEMKWPAALLNVIGVRRAAITGEGRVDARGKFCWDKYWAMRKVYDAKGLRWIVDYDAKRVRTLLIQGSEDVTIKGVTFVDAGFWTVQVLYSKYVTVDGITVRNNEGGHGPSTDGIDIDSSTWVLVENCDIDCNDDDFCLKAGRDWDGLRVDRPTEYVVIRHCTARKGGGLLTIGSETSGGIRHVLAADLTARGTGNGFHIKSATTRGGTVEDIHIRNITMDSVGNAILFTMNWNPSYSYSTLPAGYNPDSIPAHWKTMLHKVEPPEKGIPHFKDIYISGITVASAGKGISATGLPASLITGVHIDHTTINAATAGEIDFAKDWQLQNVTITARDGTGVSVRNSSDVIFK